ncbi:glycosyltransferase family 4 protein [Prosthecobacter vanneervenii]|uniref:Glycosyltransferase involved in cell wall biosynthesis n=1 Tax=Prosthecobacter vanneervenii TaxID=48466 RepID=A0A7W7Y6J0_9BACT|nr:glycosyltransferase family 4 protein [Prosthecobacter vanneervenii]MBB5030491.1 glycosyltransferase involved in cell wall biosynthesis [Prosthecobacter vanneervenii]
MKFIFISANQGGGGSEELWVQTAGRLQSKGHAVMALTEWKAGAQRRLQQLESFGVPHRPLDLTGRRAVISKILERMTGGMPRRLRRLQALLKLEQPDLIIFNSGTLVDGIPLLEVIHEGRHPCVVVTHLVSTDNWPDDTLAERIHRTYSQALEACFVSEHNRELFVRQTGRRLPNARIVRNPFLVSVAAIPMPQLGPEMPVKLALPARLHPKTKGHDMLFEALARPEWRERKIQVSLLGNGGCERTLRALCQELQIADKVVFSGHVDDMNAVWREHHALLLPSRHEGLPIALIEAMWAGRAVIATPAGGIPEMIQPGSSGFLATGCDTEALHEVMDRAWSNRDHWEAMGAAGRRLVQERIPADPVKVWTERLLELAAEHGRP